MAKFNVGALCCREYTNEYTKKNNFPMTYLDRIPFGHFGFSVSGCLEGYVDNAKSLNCIFESLLALKRPHSMLMITGPSF